MCIHCSRCSIRRKFSRDLRRDAQFAWVDENFTHVVTGTVSTKCVYTTFPLLHYK